MSEFFHQSGKRKNIKHRENSLLQRRPKKILQDNRESVPQLAAADHYQQAARPAGHNGLPDKLKSGIENLSGYAMDDVKVHYNSGKPQQVQAHAYTQGTDIHLATGQEKHLPHEAWHVIQQKQGRVRPTLQLQGIHINDDAALETEADVMGAKALSANIGNSNERLKHAGNGTMSTPIQRRVSVGNYTVATAKNIDEIEEYVVNKQKYDQAEENKNSGRNKTLPRQIAPLKLLHFDDLLKPLAVYYQEYSPPCSLDDIYQLLYDWANAKSPSEVNPDESGILPLVSTQDNHFDTVKDLFLALVQNIRAQKNQELQEKAVFSVLENFDTYLPVVIHILVRIDEEIKDISQKKSILSAGYAKNILGQIESGPVDIPDIILRQKTSLERLFLAINTIHSFLIATKQLAFVQRTTIKNEMGDRHDKYSPYGPGIEEARQRGYAVWSGFSGSTADILNLAVQYELSPSAIHKLALTVAAFFHFLPTSKNPTHTFHEVMLVANKFFNVPYNSEDPSEHLPHHNDTQASESSTASAIGRVGNYGENVQEIAMDKLFWLHNVPRQGTPEGHIGNIAKKIKEEGFNVESPVSATLLPNGNYLVTGGHHRIAAMKQLGEKTIPIKVYSANQTDPVFLARMLGIARITGKYFDLWSPHLTDDQRKTVNNYLERWMAANSDQVRYKFVYQTPIRSNL